MTQFAYTVSDPTSGGRSTGVLVASDYDAAFRVLTERNFIVTSLAPVRPGLMRLLARLGIHRRSVTDEQLLSLTQQISAMLRAGLTVRQSVEIVLNDTDDPRFKGVLLEMSTALGAGASFTEVLSLHSQVFDRQYVALISAGESGGKLPEIMRRLAVLIESNLSLRKRLKTAMYYPSFVILFAALVLGGLFIFLVPRFDEIYRGFGGELPPMTRILIAGGRFAQTYVWALLGLLVVGVVALRSALRTRRFAEAVDGLKLRLPIMGPLLRQMSISRFSRTLGTLHSSGVPIAQALDLVAASMNNLVLEQAVREARVHVMEGEALSAPLRRSGLFTEMSLSMIAAGEHSGALDEMLSNIADYYDSQVDMTLRGLAGLIEPFVMVGVGVMIGFILVALILPIFKLSTMLLTK